MTILTRGPKPVYYVMGKQSSNNSYPGLWAVLDDTAEPKQAISRLEQFSDSVALALYYDELAIFMHMGSIPLPKGG